MLCRKTEMLPFSRPRVNKEEGIETNPQRKERERRVKNVGGSKSAY